MYTLQSVPEFASLIVHLVLEELGQPYSLNTVSLDTGDLDSPAHRALNPFGKIPAMQTPDGPMFETAAILMYLSELTPNGLAPAPGSPDRAAFLKWLFFTSTNLHTTLMQTYYPIRTAGPDCTDAVVTHARTVPGVEEVVLAVTVGNELARRLYVAAGFTEQARGPNRVVYRLDLGT